MFTYTISLFLLSFNSFYLSQTPFTLQAILNIRTTAIDFFFFFHLNSIALETFYSQRHKLKKGSIIISLRDSGLFLLLRLQFFLQLRGNEIWAVVYDANTSSAREIYCWWINRAITVLGLCLFKYCNWKSSFCACALDDPFMFIQPLFYSSFIFPPIKHTFILQSI